jgi:hypothetical protein
MGAVAIIRQSDSPTVRQLQCMSRRDLSVKGGTSERCYRTRRGRTDEQRYAIISPYFDGRIKMNGPYPENMVHVYTINWFKKVQNINYRSHAAQPTFNCHKRGGGGVSWHSCLFCHCFSVSSDDKLVLFSFPGIPTGDPAIVAFYDKRIYKKVRLKELSLSDPLYHGKKQHWNMTK